MTNQKTIDRLDLQGITVERPTQTGMVWAPPVLDVENGALICDVAQRHKVNVGAGMLQNFLGLSEATDEQIYQYGKKWGALGVGSDGWPAKEIGAAGTTVYREPTEGWRRVAARFLAAINLEAAFVKANSGAEADWMAFDDPAGRYDPVITPIPPWKLGVTLARTELSAAIREMVHRYQVAPRFWWNKKSNEWQLDLDAFGVSNLPGLLVIQLLIVIADKDGYALCSSCHKSYIPARRPDPTRRNYCTACRSHASQRDAARDYRQRRREGKKTERGKRQKKQKQQKKKVSL